MPSGFQHAALGLSLAGCVVAGTIAGCGAQLPPSPVADGEPWAGTSTTEGNVTTVVNESGSVWGGTAVLVEEASIGVAFGSDPYMFGRVSSVAASDDRIYVTDRQVGALRVYDWSGRHLRDVGRKGQGPGEFQSAASVGIDAQGRIWLDDMLGARILVFSAAGESLATLSKRPPLGSGPTPMVVTADGRGFVLGVERETETTPGRRGMIGYELDGSAGDLVVFPDFDDPPVFSAETPDGRSSWGIAITLYPRGIAVLTPAPAVLSGYPESYRFRLDFLDGKTTIIERPAAVIPVSAAEAAAVESAATDYLTGVNPGWRWPDAPLPQVKPAYNNLIAAVGGEIWVARSGPATPISNCDEGDFEPDGKPHCWREPRIVDIFGADGRYLGDVIVPDDLVLGAYRPPPYIRGTDVIGIVEDEEGTIRVKRWRLVLPGEDGDSSQ